MRGHRQTLGISFWGHNLAQFLGALNDNVFRWLTAFFLIGLLGHDKTQMITSRTGMIFVIPFLLFTAPAGFLADHFPKRSIVIAAKAVEIFVMLLGCAAFYFQNILLLYVALFLMCTQSAFFGPSKYGIIPELVKSDQISLANGYIEGFTYLAIVLGSGFTPWLADRVAGRYDLAAGVCILIAVAGWLASLKIAKVTQNQLSATKSSVWSDTVELWRLLSSRKALIGAIIAAGYFLFVGGFCQMNLIAYGLQTLSLNEFQSGYLFLAAAIGIGIGSWLAGKAGGRWVETGLIPLAGIGIAICLGLLGAIPSQSQTHVAVLANVAVLVFLFGISCGAFVVPVYAYLQIFCPEKLRGRLIAAANFAGWIGVLLAAILLMIFGDMLKIPARGLFTGLAVVAGIVAIVCAVALIEPLLRLILAAITKTAYRIRIVGLDNVPKTGPALLIANHVSWADPLILMATQKRTVRFLVDRNIYNRRLWNWLLRLGKMVPISAGDSPKQIVRALQQSRQLLHNGDIVCLFIEGAVTRTGMLGRFRSGYEKIVQHTDFPIIPVYLGGLWGSIFSYYYGKLLGSWPKPLRRTVAVHFGKPLPPTVKPIQLREAIQQLSSDYFDAQKNPRRTLGHLTVKSCRKFWFKPFLSDTTGKRLTFGKALIATVLLKELLKNRLRDQTTVGIFLPPSAGAVLANVAVAVMGKTSANLSYAVSIADRQSMIEQAGLKTILTARAFLEKIKLDPQTLPQAVFLEDLLPQATPFIKIKALLKAMCLPTHFLVAKTAHPDQTAALLFSSGSTGKPKGIELTHHNIISNLQMVLSAFRILPNDRLCAILPLFHSFGLTCTLWLPLYVGVPVSYVANPLDAAAVASAIGQDRCTLLFATPTFLLHYLRRCEKEDFASLRFVVAGSEKLRISLMDAFEEKFGIRPREGYGATELSPLVSLNVPDQTIDGVRQIGTKDGTVGQSIPGLVVQVRDIDTGQPLDFDQEGLLWAKGPNVMKGYLNRPDLTATAIVNGWYNTGDIVRIDEEGFITITDRLSRFSKIGGEMVPHIAIEEHCLKKLNTLDPIVGVVGIPDQKTGEQIVLFFQQDKTSVEQLYEILTKSELPRLYIPKKENIIPLETLPRLGSGKLDVQQLKKIAIQRLSP